MVARFDGGTLISGREQRSGDGVFSFARNHWLVTHIASYSAWAEDEAQRKRRAAVRRLALDDGGQQVQASTRCRLVTKAEWMRGRGDDGSDPGFVVNSLKAAEVDARTRYQDVSAPATRPRTVSRSHGFRLTRTGLCT